MTEELTYVHQVVIYTPFGTTVEFTGTESECRKHKDKEQPYTKLSMSIRRAIVGMCDQCGSLPQDPPERKCKECGE